MPTPDETKAAGKEALGKLFELMNAALDAHDKDDQKALLTKIQTLTDKLDVLDDAGIAADDARIADLNKKLGAVTDAATASLTDLHKVGDVLDKVLAVANLIDTIVGAAAKLTGG